MEDNSRGRTPQEVLDAKMASVQYVSSLMEAVEDVASRTSLTNMFVTNAVQPISEKHPEIYILEDRNIKTTSIRRNLIRSSTITRKIVTLVTSLTIMSV